MVVTPAPTPAAAPARARPGSARLHGYVVLMAVSVALGWLQSMFLSKILGTDGFGYFAIAATLVSYLQWLQFGVMNGLGRELPIALGAADRDGGARLVGAATLFLAAVLGIGVCAYQAVVAGLTFDDPHVRLAACLAGGWLVSTQLFQLVILRMRSEGDLLGFPLVLIGQKGISLLAGTLVAWHFGFAGVLVCFMAIESAFYLAITRFRLAPASYRGARAADALGLVRCGLPYVLVSFVGALVLGMDKLFLMESAAASRVGIYQMASMPLLMGVSLGAVVNQYLFPSLLREYGRHGSVRAVHQRMRTILLRLLAGFLLLIPLEYLAAHVVIVWFLPEYTESLPVLAVFCVSGAFTAANVSGITLYARNRPRLFLVSSGIVTLLAFPVLFWLNQQPDVALLWYAVVNACVIVLEFVLRFLFAGACARAEA